MPELFFDFSPGTKPEDLAELKRLMDRQGGLGRYSSMISRSSSEKDVGKFFQKVRDDLKALNPAKYDEAIAFVDDYQLIKQYNNFYRELKK